MANTGSYMARKSEKFFTIAMNNPPQAVLDELEMPGQLLVDAAPSRPRAVRAFR